MVPSAINLRRVVMNFKRKTGKNKTERQAELSASLAAREGSTVVEAPAENTPVPVENPEATEEVQAISEAPAVQPVEAPAEPVKEKAKKKQSKTRDLVYAGEKQFPPEWVITMLVSENPKQQHSKSRERFEAHYHKEGAMTVADYMEYAANMVVQGEKVGKTLAMNDLKWDTAKGFCTIGPIQG